MDALDQLAAAFSQVDTTAVADAGPDARAMSAAIAPRSASVRLCAPAFTVRTRRDILAVARAVEAAPAGSVLVVDGGGEEVALSGELFARGALARGLAGIVVDGGVRDVGYLRTCPLPVYSRHVLPRAGTSRDPGEFGVPVTCGGVTVQSGDVVLADVEGVLVLDAASALDRVRAAAAVKATEARAVALLSAGGTLSDCLNLTEHVAALAGGEPSALRFVV